MSGNIFRNYAAALTSPTAWIGMLLILGVILIWRNHTKGAKWIFSVATFFFILFSFDPMTEILLNHYENRYPAFNSQSLKNPAEIKHIVVLAGGYVPNPPLHPITSEITKFTLVRLIEGIRIHKLMPGSKLVFTGKGWAQKTEAQAMKELAVGLGVSDANIILEEESTNTYAHTLNLKNLLKDEPFILVTSALHMPRAMGVFEKAGYKPIPAPTGHILLGPYEIFNMVVPFSRGDNLEAIDLWFNEFSAIMREKVTGKI